MLLPKSEDFARAMEGRVVGFSRLLRQHGFAVGVAETEDLLRIAEHFLCTEFAAFQSGARALICNSVDEFRVFDPLFEGYWCAQDAASRIDPERMVRPRKRRDAGPGILVTTGVVDAAAGDDPDRTLSGASAVASLRKADFSQVEPADQERLERLAANLWQRMALDLSRRLRGHQGKPKLHLRRTVRRNLSQGGDPVRLVYAGKKPRKPRLVVLLDVSGSMELYSFFLLRLLYAMQSRFRKVSSFVFSTDLVDVTGCLKSHALAEALAQVSHLKVGWSGGTRLGDCLRQLLDDHGPRVLRRDTVFMILSDGLDVGPPERLAAGLREVKARTSRIVWLNPLLGQESYEPLAGGMQAALPLVDVFAPAHNLESLMDIGRLLRG